MQAIDTILHFPLFGAMSARCCPCQTTVATSRFVASSCPVYIRYVGYFWSVLSNGPKPVGALLKPRTVQIRQVQITGLPPGAADECVVVVEARQSGSAAASATRVFASPVQKASNSSMQCKSSACMLVGAIHTIAVMDWLSCRGVLWCGLHWMRH